MREHFYTYPTVVELRADRDRDRDRAPVPGGAGAERRSQPPVASHMSGVAAQPQTQGSHRSAR
jgi:hypothetical protein